MPLIEKGGVNGHLIVPIVKDGRSNWAHYAKLAKQLIVRDHVVTIFGCWTSACRKTILPIIEKHKILLIYPTQYEGVEDARNVIYLGEMPNQQTTPAVKWMLDHYGKKVFLIGSNYIYPRVANEIMAHEVALFGGQVVGVNYVPLGSNKLAGVIHQIRQARPDFILNTLNGSSNVAFFKMLHQQDPKHGPVMSFSLGEALIHKIPAQAIVGNLTAWSYYTSIQTPQNKAFLKQYRSLYHSIDQLNPPAIAAYAGIKLWAKAIKDSHSMKPQTIYEYMLNESTESPGGIFHIDPRNAHAWRNTMIAKINAKRQAVIVWRYPVPIEPVVYPDFKNRIQWGLFESELYLKWGKHWDAGQHD